MEGTNSFVDILEKRRQGSDILWASRSWTAVKAYKPLHEYSAEDIKSIVLKSHRLKKILSQISKSQGMPLLLMYDASKKILDEIGYKREVSILRWLGLLVSKILKKLCTSVYVNETKFLEIRSSMGSNPVLFVPSHKSYCDFILMSYICFTYDVDIPRIAAGMDFQSMAIMGTVLRDACAFFMRRSFTRDELYSAVFSQYVQTLVTDGDAAVEFFIEGTRSRTAKSLMPKYGFLSMTLKPFFVGLVPDITVIPVNLSYDRVLEETLFAYELLGVPKPKESTKGFLKSLSILNQSYGNMYIQFGDAFSVKEYFGDKLDRSIHGSGSVQMQDLTGDESKQIRQLAHTIVRKQRELTVLNCFNLIATVLNNNIISNEKSLTVNELSLEIEWLYAVFKVLTPSSTLWALNAIDSNLILHHLKLHSSLIFITELQEILLCKVHAPNSSIDATKLKGHNLSNSTMDISIPLLMLQYYVNPCANFLISVCFIALIVQTLSEDCSIGSLFNEFKFLCSVFSYEFVFHPDFIQKDFDEAVEQSQQLHLINVVDSNRVEKGNNEKLHSFCINFLSSYIPGYITVAEFFLSSGGAILHQQEILKGCQKMVEKKLRNGSILHPANLSLDMLSNAYQAFITLKAITKIDEKNSKKCSINQNEMNLLHSKLKSFDFCKKSNSNISQQFSKIFIRNNL